MEVDITLRNVVLISYKTMSVIAEGERHHAREHRIGTVMSGMEEMLKEVHIARKISCMLKTVV